MTDHLHRAVLVSLATVGLVLSTPACDTNARFNIVNVAFDEARVVSVYPAVDDGGTLVRQCGAGPVDGFIVNTILLSTPRKGASANDKDRSIRPGDRINGADVDGPAPTDIDLTGTTNLGIAIDCIDPLPDPDGSTACQGVAPSASGGNVHYEAFSSKRDLSLGHDVLILIDMSGSTKGFVDEDTGKENSPSASVNFPTNLQNIASDYSSVRLAAVGNILNDLNESDRVGVVAYGEGLDNGPLVTACGLPEVEGQSFDVALDTCFPGKNRDIWKSGINALQNASKPGRANLWHAVAEAYDYLKSNSTSLQRTKHILVVSDGPDTCERGIEFGSCQVPCSQEVSFDDVMSRVDNDEGVPNVPQIHVHFVQFESEGYAGPDPRQMELACRTNGQYQFINGNTLSRINVDAFTLALREAVGNVRYSLMGTWQIPVRSPLFATDAPFPTGVPRGNLYKLQGSVTVKGSSNMIENNEQYLFTGGAPGLWDQRLTVRKSCSSAADCGGADPGSSCSVVCSAETRTCPGGSAGVSLPDGIGCPGESGVCCGGACQAGSCAACQP